MRTALRASLLSVVASTLVTFLVMSFLFAQIARAADAASVTGFDTGYSYHQGLATGAGGQLMAQSSPGANTDSLTASANANSGAALTNGDTGGQAIAPSVAVSAPAPVVETVAAPNTTAASAPTLLEQISSFFTSSAFLWSLGVLVIIVLAIAIAGMISRSRPQNRRTYASYG